MNRAFIYKLSGTILVLVGLFVVAKHDRYLPGLVLLFVGFYLAMKKGMKPR